MIPNQSTSEKPPMCQTSVSLTPCCTKHTSGSFYQGLTCVDPYYHYVKYHIKHGVISHSAQETGQQKEQ